MLVLGICSGGGHLAELQIICRHMAARVVCLTDRSILELHNKDSNFVYPIINPHRSILRYVLNVFHSLYYLYKFKPDCILTTGAGIAIPIFVLGRILGKTCIYVETGSRINTPSRTGLLLYKFAHVFIIQSEDLSEFYPNATFAPILPIRGERI